MKKLFGQIPLQLIIMMITMIGVTTIALTSVYPELRQHFPFKESRQGSLLDRIDFQLDPITLSPRPQSNSRTVEFDYHPEEANLDDITFDFAASDNFFEIDEASKEDGIVGIAYVGPNVLPTGRNTFLLSAVSKSDPAKTFGELSLITINVPVVDVPDEVSIQSDNQTASLTIKPNTDLSSEEREGLKLDWRDKSPDMVSVGPIMWEENSFEGIVEIPLGTGPYQELILSYGEYELKSIRVVAAARVASIPKNDEDGQGGPVPEEVRNIEFPAGTIKLDPFNIKGEFKFVVTPEYADLENLEFDTYSNGVLVKDILSVDLNKSSVELLDTRVSSDRNWSEYEIVAKLNEKKISNELKVGVARPKIEFESDKEGEKLVLSPDSPTVGIQYRLLPTEYHDPRVRLAFSHADRNAGKFFNISDSGLRENQGTLTFTVNPSAFKTWTDAEGPFPVEAQLWLTGESEKPRLGSIDVALRRPILEYTDHAKDGNGFPSVSVLLGEAGNYSVPYTIEYDNELFSLPMLSLTGAVEEKSPLGIFYKAELAATDIQNKPIKGSVSIDLKHDAIVPTQHEAVIEYGDIELGKLVIEAYPKVHLDAKDINVPVSQFYAEDWAVEYTLGPQAPKLSDIKLEHGEHDGGDLLRIILERDRRDGPIQTGRIVVVPRFKYPDFVAPDEGYSTWPWEDIGALKATARMLDTAGNPFGNSIPIAIEPPQINVWWHPEQPKVGEPFTIFVRSRAVANTMRLRGTIALTIRAQPDRFTVRDTYLEGIYYHSDGKLVLTPEPPVVDIWPTADHKEIEVFGRIDSEMNQFGLAGTRAVENEVHFEIYKQEWEPQGKATLACTLTPRTAGPLQIEARASFTRRVDQSNVVVLEFHGLFPSEGKRGIQGLPVLPFEIEIQE